MTDVETKRTTAAPDDDEMDRASFLPLPRSSLPRLLPGAPFDQERAALISYRSIRRAGHHAVEIIQDPPAEVLPWCHGASVGRIGRNIAASVSMIPFLGALFLLANIQR